MRPPDSNKREKFPFYGDFLSIYAPLCGVVVVPQEGFNPRPHHYPR